MKLKSDFCRLRESEKVKKIKKLVVKFSVARI
jgi:hypothetical protein